MAARALDTIDAIQQWTETHAFYVRWAAKERLGSEGSETVVSDAELELLKRLDARPPRSRHDFDRERYWAFRSALRTFVRRRHDNPVPLSQAKIVNDRDPAYLFNESETYSHFATAIRELCPAQRAVILLFYFADLPDVEIGMRLDRSTSAVKQLRYRALENLRTTISYSTRLLLSDCVAS